MYQTLENTSFKNETTVALLSLLAMTALSDKRLFAAEIESYMSSAQLLDSQNYFTEAVSEAKILMWFELNKDHLLYIIRTPDFAKWHEACLDALEDIQNKSLILEAMTSIAKSDDDFHFGEKALIQLTARRWKLDVEYA